jgi:hypothetical protein
MRHDRENPATLATRGAPECDCLVAINSENKPKATGLQAFRASFVARKCGISHAIARIVAPVVFAEGGR